MKVPVMNGLPKGLEVQTGFRCGMVFCQGPPVYEEQAWLRYHETGH